MRKAHGSLKVATLCPSKDSHPIICRTAKADLYDVVPLSCRPGQEEDDSEKNLSKKQQRCEGDMR